MIQRSQTSFEPFPPNLDLLREVESTPNFAHVERIHCNAIDAFPREDFERLVLFHVVLLGLPLVIEGLNSHLDKHLFSEKWLRQNYERKSTFLRSLY